MFYIGTALALLVSMKDTSDMILQLQWATSDNLADDGMVNVYFQNMVTFEVFEQRIPRKQLNTLYFNQRVVGVHKGKTLIQF